MEASGVRLWNPPAILRWNTDKRYLARLSHPHLSRRRRRSSNADRPSIWVRCSTRGWDEAVMKPAISADGFSTGARRATGAAD